MRLSPRETQDLRRAADAWAERKGLENAAAVPPEDISALILAVAATTDLDPKVVRDAVFAGALTQVDAAAEGQAKLGTQGRYQGARGHVPLRSDGGARPVAVMIDARAEADAPKKTGIDALATQDRNFNQTVADFQSMRIAVTEKASPRVLNEVNEAGIKLLRRYEQLEGHHDDRQLREEIIRLHKDLVSKLAQTKGIFVVKAPKDGELPSFTLDSAPAGDVQGAAKTARDEAYAALAEKVAADGSKLLEPERRGLIKKLPGLAVDGESGDRFVLDFHGRVRAVFTLEDFVGAHQAALDGQRKQVEHLLPAESLADLKRVPDKALERLTGQVSYVSLVEGDADPVTRVYPTRWYKPSGSILHQRVITDGPFKGIFLDELINAVGQHRGVGFSYDPRTGPKGDPLVPRAGEPFVTTAKVMERGQKREKLYVRIPFENEYTPIRQALRRLSELDPAIKYDKGTKNTGFYFPAESYKAVRDVLRGLTLSEPALKILETHFAELSAMELAAADQNLAGHSAKAIGGFRKEVRGADGKMRPVELGYWQRKSLAWLEARNYQGVVSLDTGMGKTLVGVAAMRELMTRHDEKRRFLVVCPPALRGNFTKEIHKFLTEEAAAELMKRLDVMAYPEFMKAAKSGTHGGKPFDAKNYGAVLFDEAQWLKNLTAGRTKAALALEGTRKICLTASPMENSPMEAYVLACIANGVNLADRAEGKEHRWRMRKFKELYCEVLGGRILGVKQNVELLPKVNIDPKHNLYTWVRSNIFHADKEVDDVKLPKFNLTADTLTMPKQMEDEYRKRAHRLTKVLRGMVSLFRDKGIVREYVDDKGRTKLEINPLARDKRINLMFGVKYRSMIEALNEVGNTLAKVHRAADILWNKLDANPRTRAVLFSDNSKFVLESAQELSRKIPGKIHAAGLGSEIRLYRDGEELKEFAGHALPFKQKAYRKDPERDAGPDNRQHEPHEWQQFVLNEVIGANEEVLTTTLFAPVYQQGQNLQWANLGFHLDRDTWNRENTKQREARLWRKGQDQPVDFYNLDWVYKKPQDGLDRTLDEIRSYHELVAEALFRDVIETPQKTIKLGEEWTPVRLAEDLVVDFDMLRLGLGPSAELAGRTGVHA